MVHLGKVLNDKAIKDQAGLLPKMKGLDLEAADDDFTASVYGSRFAARDLPKHEMPDGEMPREVAYRMIKDDLTLDGTPTLKSVSSSFLPPSTWTPSPSPSPSPLCLYSVSRSPFPPSPPCFREQTNRTNTRPVIQPCLVRHHLHGRGGREAHD